MFVTKIERTPWAEKVTTENHNTYFFAGENCPQLEPGDTFELNACHPYKIITNVGQVIELG